MQKQIVLIIGLPGSGKTTLAQTKYADHELYDDFIFHLFNGQLQAAIKQGTRVCLTDPRMVIPELFERYTTRLGLTPENTHLILFENNPEQCTKNNSTRDRQLGNAIENYSNMYSVSYYSRWNPEIRSVFSG